MTFGSAPSARDRRQMFHLADDVRLSGKSRLTVLAEPFPFLTDCGSRRLQAGWMWRSRERRPTHAVHNVRVVAMSDAKLVKSWKITATLLERARHALPLRHEQERAPLLAQYSEFLEHNELELAFDVLEELGHLMSARGEFWRDLERAAENMGLVDRLPALRKAFSVTDRAK